MTADTEFQRNIFKGLSESGQLHGQAVRQAIGARRTRSDAPTALFVGLDAYRAAGGTTEDPLFEDDYVSILDPDLMEELALRKLNAVAAKYADDWKWTAAQPEFTWLDQQNHLIADAEQRAEFTEEETAALNEAEERIERASAQLDTFDSDLDAEGRRELWDIVTREQARYADIERDRADRDAFSETVRAHAGVVVALDRDGSLDIHRGLVRTEDAAAYRAARAGHSGNGAGGRIAAPNATDGSIASPNATDGPVGAPALPDAAGDAPPAKRNGGYTDALRNDFRIVRTAAVRRALARDPAVATDLIGFVLARSVGFGRRHPGYEAPVLALRREYQGVYASDAMKASETMKHLDPVPAVDLGWLAEDDAAAAFRAYRALPDEDRASVLAHAVASLTVPRLADDNDASGAHEEAVRDLGIDFPAELAAVGARPFDADLVWNRMNKGLILGAAAETLGDDWASKHNGLKKKDLVTAAAEAFRHDPARDAAVDAAAARWLPPGFAPAEVAAEAPEDTPDVATEADAGAGASSEGNASSASDEPSVAAPAESDASADDAPVSGNGESAEPAESDAPAATMSGNGAGESPADDGALPAFLTS